MAIFARIRSRTDRTAASREADGSGADGSGAEGLGNKLDRPRSAAPNTPPVSAHPVVPAGFAATRLRPGAALAPVAALVAALALAALALVAVASPAAPVSTTTDESASAPSPGDGRPGPEGAQSAQLAASPSGWTVPRTPLGHPDLQGNWSNATITPIQRPEGQGPVHAPEDVARMEERLRGAIASGYADSDPDREAPPVGGVFTGDPRYDAASGGTGGYNAFYIDAGERVAVFNGEARTSLIVDPGNGRLPPLTGEGRARMEERRRLARQFGAYDNPENRPLAERCIMSFGSNAGPPMLPNYFYNNNYTIVQTPGHVMIMTEMVHDVRIIRMGEPRPLPAHIRPWMGDSWGRWEGDTLVVETTNLHPDQTLQGIPPSENMKVTERFTRAGEHVVHYEFTVDDPVTFERPWSGEVPFTRLNGLVYEYACHEANYALENVLRGARAQERRQEGDE